MIASSTKFRENPSSRSRADKCG